MTKLKLYPASKLTHAPFWKFLRQDWKEFDFVATWPEKVGVIPDTPEFATEFWQQDLNEVAECDVVICLAKGNDILRGALVEAGAALALGKRVIVIGASESYGTWQYHERVYQARDIGHARELLNEWARVPGLV